MVALQDRERDRSAASLAEQQQRLVEVEGQLAQASGELATARRSEVALRERLQVGTGGHKQACLQEIRRKAIVL